jgi:hypothetical protein
MKNLSTNPPLGRQRDPLRNCRFSILISPQSIMNSSQVLSIKTSWRRFKLMNFHERFLNWVLARVQAKGKNIDAIPNVKLNHRRGWFLISQQFHRALAEGLNWLFTSRSCGNLNFTPISTKVANNFIKIIFLFENSSSCERKFELLIIVISLDVVFILAQAYFLAPN